MSLIASLRFVCLLKGSRNTFSQSRGFKRWLAPSLRTFNNLKIKLGPQPPINRNAFIEWNYKAELFAFGNRLGEDFDLDLLEQAFTTREYINNEIEKQKAVGIENVTLNTKDNTEVIKSGEKIINDYVLRYLRTVFPKLPEEGIYTIKQYLTTDELLSMISSNLGVGDLILTVQLPPTQKTLADTLKAIIGNLSVCSGLSRANLFVRDFIVTQLVGKNINDLWNIPNPIELLSEIMKRDGKPSVEPRLIGEAGRNTILADYQVGLYQNKQLIGVGFGESILTAKEMAARNVLQKLFNTTESEKPIPFNLELNSDSSEPFANLSVQDWCEKNVSKLVQRV